MTPLPVSLARLFESTNVASLQLQNRIVMAPMTRSFCPNGIPTDLVAAYYRRRAENNVGLIITEGTCIGHKAASAYKDVPFISGKNALDGWRNVVDGVHAADGKIISQLWHVGAIRRANKGIGPDQSVPGYSPSGLLKKDKPSGKTMTLDDIDNVIQSFVQAAFDAKSIGFDGIELHGAHGYLIDQFFWNETNQRDDEYGGSISARSKFAVDIIKGIRNKCGNKFPISLRFSQWKQQDYSARLAKTPAELEEFLNPLVVAGVDIFHCSTRRFWEPEFDNSPLNLAGWTKKLTGKPVITVGSIGLNSSFIDEKSRDMRDSAKVTKHSFEELATRLDQEEFDLIAVGRALLQDPKWVNKVKQGRIDDIDNYSKQALNRLY